MLNEKLAFPDASLPRIHQCHGRHRMNDKTVHAHVCSLRRIPSVHIPGSGRGKCRLPRYGAPNLTSGKTSPYLYDIYGYGAKMKACLRTQDSKLWKLEKHLLEESCVQQHMKSK